MGNIGSHLDLTSKRRGHQARLETGESASASVASKWWSGRETLRNKAGLVP